MNDFDYDDDWAQRTTNLGGTVLMSALCFIAALAVMGGAAWWWYHCPK